MKHVSWLRIPTSFIDGLPPKAKRQLRYCVTWFQYHVLLGVTALQGELQMSPRDPDAHKQPSAPISPGFGKLLPPPCRSLRQVQQEQDPQSKG